MPNIEKHNKLAATTITELYEAPKDNSTISCICLCNSNASTTDTYNLWVVPEGDTRWAEHLIASLDSITASNSKFIVTGITPKSGTKIYWESTNWYISFSIYWSEWV